MIPAHVINLARDTGRMGFQADQLERLGIPWQRHEAVTPAEVTPPAEDRYWQGWQRPMRPAEQALLCSHMRVWEHIQESGKPGLVLEDDALLSAQTPELLTQIEGLDGIEHLNLETRNRKKLVGKDDAFGLPMRRLWLDRCGSAAFVLWPEGAARLIRAARHAPALSDALIAATPGLRSYQAVPALAIQLDQCATYEVPAPIEAPSGINSTARPDQKSPAQTARRLWAQARMGARQLRQLQGARRMMVPYKI